MQSNLDPESRYPDLGRRVWEVMLLVTLFFVAAGDSPPSVNEAHYLIKAKSYWQPNWLAHDIFVASPKEHVLFYSTIGWFTQVTSLPNAAWMGRFIGWTLLATGLQFFVRQLIPLRYASLGVGVVWIVAVQYANLAGEWIVGGIEAKVLAYGFVLLTLSEIARGRWLLVWPLLGVAAAFHVLVGGWSVACAMLVRVAMRKDFPDIRLGKELATLCLGGLISLIGVLPGLALNGQATSSEALIAAHIYAYGRLTHHLSPASFPWTWFACHGGLIAFSAISYRWLSQRMESQGLLKWRSFAWFWVGTLGIASTGLLIGVLPAVVPGLAAKLLRFYWFRMTDAFTGLAVALMVIGWITVPLERPFVVQVKHKLIRAVSIVALFSCVLVLANRVLNVLEFDSQLSLARAPTRETMIEIASPNVQAQWRDVCKWVRESTASQAIFITPRHQQTFKWYAERSEVVNWKDIPQDAKSLIEWACRVNLVFPRELGRRHPPVDIESLNQFARDWGANYILIDRRVVRVPVPLLQVYPATLNENSVFAVYAMPKTSTVADVPIEGENR